MSEILHRLPIGAPAARVFEMFSTAAGLNEWWTLTAEADPKIGGAYRFGFGPEFDWSGVVTRFEPGVAIEWQMRRADADWTGTIVGAHLVADGDRTTVDFYHRGWSEPNDHFRTTSCCWASLLRVMRRYLEHGERVPYADRLNV